MQQKFQSNVSVGSTKYYLNKPTYKDRIHWSDGTDIILELQYYNAETTC